MTDHFNPKMGRIGNSRRPGTLTTRVLEHADRTWLVIDAVDGRAHYVELGRINPDAVPSRGMLVALGRKARRPALPARARIPRPI